MSLKILQGDGDTNTKREIIQGNVSLVNNNTDEEILHRSHLDPQITLDPQSSKLKINSEKKWYNYFNTNFFGNKGNNKFFGNEGNDILDKCRNCINGYQIDKKVYYTIYYIKNEKIELILLIDKNNGKYKVKILSNAGYYRDEDITKEFDTIEDLNKKYPVLKAIPTIKIYILMKPYESLKAGERFIPSMVESTGNVFLDGKELVKEIDFVVDETPDYESAGLEPPRLVGGRKSKNCKKSRKYKKSRKSKKSNKTKKIKK